MSARVAWSGAVHRKAPEGPRSAAPRWAGTSTGLTCAPQADTASPAALATLTAALMSRSRTALQAPPSHTRMCRGLGPSLTPQAEQTREVGSNRPMRRKLRPNFAALYSSVGGQLVNRTGGHSGCGPGHRLGRARAARLAAGARRDCTGASSGATAPPRTGPSRDVRRADPAEPSCEGDLAGEASAVPLTCGPPHRRPLRRAGSSRRRAGRRGSARHAHGPCHRSRAVRGRGTGRWAWGRPLREATARYAGPCLRLHRRSCPAPWVT